MSLSFVLSKGYFVPKVPQPKHYNKTHQICLAFSYFNKFNLSLEIETKSLKIMSIVVKLEVKE